MGKLRLELEALVVESFTTGRGAAKGTVKAFDSTNATDCSPCDGVGTGYDYCADGTGVFCKPTVAGTCHGGTCGGVTGPCGGNTCAVSCACTGPACNTELTYCGQMGHSCDSDPMCTCI